MDVQEPEEQMGPIEEPIEPAEEPEATSDDAALSETPEEAPAPEVPASEETAEAGPTVDDEEPVEPAEEPEATSDDAAISETPEEATTPETPALDETVEPESTVDGEETIEPADDSEAISEDATVIEEPVDEELKEGQAAWYVIHCYSGYENKVRHNLEQRIETMGMKDKIFDVVVPTQEEIEVRDGKRRTVERHIFPGYVLVNMVMSEESWYVVRNTPGVTGFVGMGTQPTPLRQEEVSQIVRRMEAEAPTVKVTFKVGERVRIVDGPFNDFRGMVSEIDMERTKVRVMVSFFGRETPVELDFLQVEKA
jgi:transcriptional antiterminator NusG